MSRHDGAACRSVATYHALSDERHTDLNGEYDSCATDYAQLTAAIVEGFERGDFDAMVERHGNDERRARSAAGLAGWWPNLDRMVGRSRRVTASMQVTDAPPTARAVLSGDDGDAVIG